MKPVSFKFKIIIGIVLFIVLVGATYYEKYVIHLSSNHQKSQAESSSIENSSISWRKNSKKQRSIPSISFID